MMVTVVVRGGVLYGTRQQLDSDPDAYRAVAEVIANHGIFGRPVSNGFEGQVEPTAIRPPLYPVLLFLISSDGVVSSIAVGIMQFLLGVATVFGVFVLARLWHNDLDRRSDLFAVAAALLVALDPLLLHQSSLVMTETLATCLTVCALICITLNTDGKSFAWSMLSGFTVGLTILCRPTFLVWLAMIVVVELVMTLQSRYRFSQVVVFLSVAIACLVPWTMRNWLVLEKPIFATTHGGYTVLLGNNASFYRHLRTARLGSIWHADREDFQIELREARDRFEAENRLINLVERDGGQELRDDRAYYARAVDVIRSEPTMFVYACLVRVGRLWSPLPHQLTNSESKQRALMRYAVASWNLVIFLFASIGILQLRRNLLNAPWLWGSLLCACFTLVHTFYWSNIRMRAPLIPFVCLLSAWGLYTLWSARRRRPIPAP